MKVKRGSSKRVSKKSTSKAKSIGDKDLQNISLVKNVLFKPARYKYIRKQEVVKGCVFCNSSKSISMETLCVYKSDYSMIVLNKFPYNSGHLLVLPQGHGGDLLKLSSDQYADLMATLKLACQAVTDIYAPAAFNLGMNHGSSAGAGIPEHLHFHVIPRWAGDLNFFPLIAQTKVVIETLEQTYQNYIGYFNNRVSS
ncbi:MAG: HIT domain-containing protein [Bdellovibrionaceae bacterium]|nr:HIT domain-containing protein [Pseudobdellovibrionaceae bacterium]